MVNKELVFLTTKNNFFLMAFLYFTALDQKYFQLCIVENLTNLKSKNKFLYLKRKVVDGWHGLHYTSTWNQVLYLSLVGYLQSIYFQALCSDILAKCLGMELHKACLRKEEPGKGRIGQRRN